MNIFGYSSKISELERCLLMLGTQLSCMVINTQGRCHANKAIACSTKWQFNELVSLSLSLNLNIFQIFLLHCEISRLMTFWFCQIKMTKGVVKQKQNKKTNQKKVHCNHFFLFGNKNVAKVIVFHRNVSTAICLQKSA